jgi:caffeoyl-CoA O-methyltransferase
MSETSTPVTEQHFKYVAERTRAEDEFLIQLKRAAIAAGMPAIWISPEQASFMQILLRLGRAREVVEVGTLAGYSAIAMARALPEGGRVRTIEIEPAYARFAGDWASRSDASGKVEVHLGPGTDVLATFADDSADAMFIDADKTNYPIYLREALRILRRGGLVMVDNAFAFGKLFDDAPADPSVAAVRAFNDHMAGVGGFQSVIVPIGDGLWVGVKR